MIKYLPTVLISILMFSLSGCSKYDTRGTVDMNKLVTLEEIWGNKEKYLGKVVTIRLKDYYSTARGWTDPLGKNERVYYDLVYMVSRNKYKSYEEFDSATPELIKKAYEAGDSILPNAFDVQILTGNANLPNSLHLLPDWIDYKGEWLNFFSKDGQFDPEQKIFDLEKRKEWYITGVVIDIKKVLRWRDSGIYKREISILPIGYKASKEIITG